MLSDRGKLNPLNVTFCQVLLSGRVRDSLSWLYPALKNLHLFFKIQIQFHYGGNIIKSMILGPAKWKTTLVAGEKKKISDCQIVAYTHFNNITKMAQYLA